MDRDAVLAAFDEQVRRRPQSTEAGDRVERDDRVVRVVSTAGGWHGVIWSGMDDRNVDAVIAAQIGRFAELSRPWEWKHYSYDRPPDLPRRLIAAGLKPEPMEELLVAEVADLALDTPAPAGVRLHDVVDQRGVEALVQVHDEVFGAEHAAANAALGRTLLAGLARQPATAAAVIAIAGELPVAAGRVEFHLGTDFASLWGGGTLSAWRRRGVFRSLVAHRAALASARGFRYLQVDASADSGPILRSLGFVQLATTTPFTHRGAAD
jgi:ribosomal protein S18 acetylase RimI-like enzyme